MARFLAIRICLMLLTLFLVSIIVFGVTELLPGDVATMILGNMANDTALQALRDQMGLDRPPVERYLDWLSGAIRGDFGTSLRMQVEVWPLVMQRLENSLALALFATILSVPISLTLGIISGLNRGKPVDHAITFVTLLGVSMPEFVVGTLLVVVFASQLGWLPATSIIEPDANLLDNLKYLVLPAVTLLFVTMAHTTRMMRASTAKVMQTDYVRTATLKGLPRRQVVLRHGVRNALIPTVTVIAMNIGWMIGGLVVVETVFGYPGLGQLMVFAIQNRDVPLLQAVVLVIATIYALTNLGADVAYAILNPKVRI